MGKLASAHLRASPCGSLLSRLLRVARHHAGTERVRPQLVDLECGDSALRHTPCRGSTPGDLGRGRGGRAHTGAWTSSRVHPGDLAPGATRSYRGGTPCFSVFVE